MGGIRTGKTNSDGITTDRKPGYLFSGRAILTDTLAETKLRTIAVEGKTYLLDYRNGEPVGIFRLDRTRLNRKEPTKGQERVTDEEEIFAILTEYAKAGEGNPTAAKPLNVRLIEERALSGKGVNSNFFLGDEQVPTGHVSVWLSTKQGEGLSYTKD